MPQVIHASHGTMLISSRAYAHNDIILSIDVGVGISLAPNRYSVQIGVRAHVLPPRDLPQDAPPYWRYLNHACNPSGRWVGLDLRARRPIAKGDELTFDYLTTEWEMNEPFQCRCGSCGGRRISGFRHASAEDRHAVDAELSPHIRELWATHGLTKPAHAAAAAHIR
ncbi:MAG: SET domain-containing protein-lysine N-methyltransferase [Planctomycetota bacterium]|nr:SET domain-containing protein-lysine N-methyltransferase [Planctomycetota bacterium]MDA1106510.1 SET domain-containing protein-lysine N-methyltransferase [Planctomycetota bacterium]